VKGKFLLSADGSEWLLPMYFTPTMQDAGRSHYSEMKRSSDKGITWSVSRILLFRVKHLHMFLFNNNYNRMAQTILNRCWSFHM
jgi:hypothetical protein